MPDNFLISRFQDYYLIYDQTNDPLVTKQGNVIKSKNLAAMELLLTEMSTSGADEYFALFSLYADISSSGRKSSFKVSELLKKDVIFSFLCRLDDQSVRCQLPVFYNIFLENSLELNGILHRQHINFVRRQVTNLGWPELIFCLYLQRRKSLFLLPILYVSGLLNLTGFVTSALTVLELPQHYQEQWLCELEKPFRFLASFMQ